MLNVYGVPWVEWLHQAGYNSRSIRNVTAARHRQLRAAWRDGTDPSEFREDSAAALEPLRNEG